MCLTEQELLNKMIEQQSGHEVLDCLDQLVHSLRLTLNTHNSSVVLNGLKCLQLLVKSSPVMGPALTQQNPLFTYIALISPGIFTGLFIAGLLGLRPDRSQIIQTVRHAVRRKKVALVINLEKSQSVSDVSQFLNNRSNTVVEAIR